MPDNTNVNANSAVVVVGRTAPVPPGQQKSEKSIPVVIANDQSTIPVAEQNKIQSEVALSLLGIPRSEVALGIFADVNTYDVNPTEWTSTPESYATVTGPDGASGTLNYGWGLTHVPEESGALVESPIDETAILTSKRFFRYQPGRVSAATFGVKTSGPGFTTISDQGRGVGIHNPAIRKYGIFDKFDGYYWETRNSGAGDNFCVVRRTQSLIYDNPVDYAEGSQRDDYGCTNPLDQLVARASESVGTGDTSVPTGFTNKEFGDLVILRDKLMMTHAAVYDPTLLQPETKNEIKSIANSGDKITLDGLGKLISNVGYSTVTGLMDITTSEAHGFYEGKYLTLAGIGMTCYLSYGVNSVPITPSTGGTGYTNGNQTNVATTITIGGVTTVTSLKVNITVSGNAVTSITQLGDGTNNQLALQEFSPGDELTIVGGNNDAKFIISKTLLGGDSIKTYPDVKYLDDNDGYTIVKVSDATNFTVNVGVSTVATFYNSGGIAIGIRTDQYVRYSKGINDNVIHSALEDNGIYAIHKIEYDTSFATGSCTVTLNNINKEAASGDNPAVVFNSNVTSDNTHFLITPVPFVQPDSTILSQINVLGGTPNKNAYTQIKTNEQSEESKGTGMFPYMYFNSDNTANEGFINTTETNVSVLKGQIDAVNKFYRKWINQNVDIDFLNVYEYRVPRSRFSGDRLDNKTDLLKYSDVVDTRLAGQSVTDPNTGIVVQDESIWNLEFDKVTMYKVEFSWYGAVGALFLAYVPVSNGEARWVRVHHLRASNQLKVSSLGNATLPITYMAYGGGGPGLSFGYPDTVRKENFTNALGEPSYSENIVKYGASYYIDGGDRGTVKLFSHATPDNIDVFGSKRTFTNVNGGAGSGNSNLDLSEASVDKAQEPYIKAGHDAGLGTSFYVGSKVLTGNPLDQNIEVIYTEKKTNHHRLYLNKTIAQGNGSGVSVSFIPNRPTPIIGLKCRDFIQSSTGRSVRNRTQVYPTRLSTGSVGPDVVQMDFLKTPLFQTTSIVTNHADTSEPASGVPAVALESNPLSSDGSYDLGKRGKPLAVKIPLSVYTGEHRKEKIDTNAVFVVGASAITPTDVSYNSTNGRLTFTKSNHNLTTSDKIRIKKKSLTFSCSLDNFATEHSYPRETDPIFDNILDGEFEVDGTQKTAGYDTATSGDYSRQLDIIERTNNTFTVRVTNATTDAPSKAEYIRDIGTGVFGYFRAKFKTEQPDRFVSVLGFLENRGQDRTKGNIQNDEYYFSALESTEDDIILPDVINSNTNKFLYESNSTPKDGSSITSAVDEFTLAPLSSVKISPQLRAPIPNTGTVVSSIFVPKTGETYDLASYFDYNKEYLSFPLTDTIESLFLVASSKQSYDPDNVGYGRTSASMSASITWEEQ